MTPPTTLNDPNHPNHPFNVLRSPWHLVHLHIVYGGFEDQCCRWNFTEEGNVDTEWQLSAFGVCRTVCTTSITSSQRSLTKGRIACRAVIEDWIISVAECCYWQLRHPILLRSVPMLFGGPDHPQQLPLPVVWSGAHLIHSFLSQASQIPPPNGILIDSSVFAELAKVVNRQTHRQNMLLRL